MYSTIIFYFDYWPLNRGWLFKRPLNGLLIIITVFSYQDLNLSLLKMCWRVMNYEQILQL